MRYPFSALALVIALTCAYAPMAFAQPAPIQGFADLVSTLTPTVVNISTTQKIKGVGAFPGIGDPRMQEQFKDFFERMLPPGAAPFGEEGDQEVQSLGSGFIISSEGYIVTNNHVIADATDVSVTLSDNTKLEAKIVGHDLKTDLALLKVESKKPLPAAKMGDSDAARVGDWVIAIGNPFGLGGTVTAGIISARARNINAGPFDDFIQTDAAINRGNSGGPLFNLQGEVIGINSAIFSPSGGNIGIGFAVPTSLAKNVIDQLKDHGHAIRGWLGVKIQMVTDEIAESMGMKKASGALVVEVTKDSPADKAGVKVGDVITKFDGKDINEMHQLPRIVAETDIGKKVAVELLRDNKPKTVSVTPAEMKEDEPKVTENADNQKVEQPGMTTYAVQGMSLANITDALRTQFSIPATVQGLVIVELNRNGEAAKSGLMFGDVITQVNDSPTPTLDDFKSAMGEARKSGRKYALLRAWRENDSLFVTLPTTEVKKEADKK